MRGRAGERAGALVLKHENRKLGAAPACLAMCCLVGVRVTIVDGRRKLAPGAGGKQGRGRRGEKRRHVARAGVPGPQQAGAAALRRRDSMGRPKVFPVARRRRRRACPVRARSARRSWIEGRSHRGGRNEGCDNRSLTARSRRCERVRRRRRLRRYSDGCRIALNRVEPNIRRCRCARRRIRGGQERRSGRRRRNVLHCGNVLQYRSDIACHARRRVGTALHDGSGVAGAQHPHRDHDIAAGARREVRYGSRARSAVPGPVPRPLRG